MILFYCFWESNQNQTLVLKSTWKTCRKTTCIPVTMMANQAMGDTTSCLTTLASSLLILKDNQDMGFLAKNALPDNLLTLKQHGTYCTIENHVTKNTSQWCGRFCTCMLSENSQCEGVWFNGFSHCSINNCSITKNNYRKHHCFIWVGIFHVPLECIIGVYFSMDVWVAIINTCWKIGIIGFLKLNFPVSLVIHP